MVSLVCGSGAWGTVLAQLLADKNEPVYLFCHTQLIADEINNIHTNSTYLPKKPVLNKNIKAFPITAINEYIEKADFIFIVVASPFYRQTLKQIKPYLRPDHIIVSATKGMEENTDKSILEIASEEFSGAILKKQFALLSGPNLAGEIFTGKPAATVIAAHNQVLAKKVQNLLGSTQLRPYISSDLIGVEYGGILKNVIAIAAGILDALELGSNAKAALLVRGLAEMKRFAVASGAKEKTITGLAGFGDLITTCLGPQSRNYNVGYRIGKGESLPAITKSMVSIAEGVKTCKVIKELAQKKKIPMPITEAVFQVLYKNLSIKETIQLLMTRELKEED
ncbi:MAG: NAD(P)-dependent glycerol-3-phosphate dehydrogenase [Candidatus Margulisbacteria bacterium]|nr:NAD(P)-dependent glycerol-3-phosphate dehydrogenase [Candidatus Margulisiibacteriota bacterium]